MPDKAILAAPTILAIDPGPQESAAVLYDGGRPTCLWIADNHKLLYDVVALSPASTLAVEKIDCYGMPVGAETFDTCIWIGRFMQARSRGMSFMLIPRREVKLLLCGDMRAKDKNIRQRLIDIFGPGREKAIGKKAAPGPLYGVKTHLWSALAVAVTAATAMKALEADE